MPTLPVHRGQQAHVGAARDELLDQLQVGRVVLDIEQGAQRRCRRALRVGTGLRARTTSAIKLWRRRRVQFDPEHASRPDGAFHADHAPHQLDQSLGHHQADARAFLAAGLLPEAIERLEQLRQLFRRQSRAGVPDADANASPACSRCTPRSTRSLLVVVFDRVGKQVDEQPASPGSGRHGQSRGCRTAGKVMLNATLLRLRLHHGLAFDA